MHMAFSRHFLVLIQNTVLVQDTLDFWLPLLPKVNYLVWETFCWLDWYPCTWYSQCFVWQCSSESENWLTEPEMDHTQGASMDWLVVRVAPADCFLTIGRTRWRKKCGDLPPPTHGESRARTPLEIAPKTKLQPGFGVAPVTDPAVCAYVPTQPHS